MKRKKPKMVDYYELDKSVLKSLKRIRKGMIKSAHIIENTREIERINLAIKLLKRSLNDYYFDDGNKYCTIDYSFHKNENTNAYSIKSEIIFDDLDNYFKIHKAKYRKLTNLERASSFNIITELCSNQSRVLAYKIIGQNGRSWWT